MVKKADITHETCKIFDGNFFLSFFQLRLRLAMKKLFAKLKALVSAFFYLIAVFFQAKSFIKNPKVILLIGAQKPNLKSHHLDGVLLFVNCLGCGFKINLFGVRQ